MPFGQAVRGWGSGTGRQAARGSLENIYQAPSFMHRVFQNGENHLRIARWVKHASRVPAEGTHWRAQGRGSAGKQLLPEGDRRSAGKVQARLPGHSPSGAPVVSRHRPADTATVAEGSAGDAVSRSILTTSCALAQGGEMSSAAAATAPSSMAAGRRLSSLVKPQEEDLKSYPEQARGYVAVLVETRYVRVSLAAREIPEPGLEKAPFSGTHTRSPSSERRYKLEGG